MDSIPLQSAKLKGYKKICIIPIALASSVIIRFSIMIHERTLATVHEKLLIALNFKLSLEIRPGFSHSRGKITGLTLLIPVHMRGDD